LLQTFAVSINLSLSDIFARSALVRSRARCLAIVARLGGANRTDPALRPADYRLDLQAYRTVRDPGNMSDAILTRGQVAAASGVGRLAPYGVWIVSGLLLVVLPMLFRSGTALTIMSLMGIAIIFALSYNMLLGQTGLLSFGHAVYYGLGATSRCTPSMRPLPPPCRSRSSSCPWSVGWPGWPSPPYLAGYRPSAPVRPLP
jgi:hypothetical protein